MSRRNGNSTNYLAFTEQEIVVIPQEDRGKLSENDYGPYFLRRWQDGRFSCCSEDLERRLIDCGVKTGTPVGIRKERYNGRSAVWHVRLLSGETPSPVRKLNGHATPAEITSAPIPEAKYAEAPGKPTLVQQLEASIAHVQAEKATPEAQVNDLLTRCAIAAIDAAKAAEAYAAAHGFPLKFREDQIQAWASTLYIQSSKQSNIRLMARNEELRNGRAR